MRKSKTWLRVEEFARELEPLVRARFPNLCFHEVGRTPDNFWFIHFICTDEPLAPEVFDEFDMQVGDLVSERCLEFFDQHRISVGTQVLPRRLCLAA